MLGFGGVREGRVEAVKQSLHALNDEMESALHFQAVSGENGFEEGADVQVDGSCAAGAEIWTLPRADDGDTAQGTVDVPL